MALEKPSESSVPREQVPAGIPSPTKLRNASRKTAAGMLSIICVTSFPTMFSTISRNMMQVSRAHSSRCLHIFELLYLKHLRARDKAHLKPAGKHKREYDRTHSGLQHDHQQRYHDQRGYASDDIDYPLHYDIGKSAEISGDHSVIHSYDKIYSRCDKRYYQRNAKSHKTPREQIAPEIVRSEKIVGIGQSELLILVGNDTAARLWHALAIPILCR